MWLDGWTVQKLGAMRGAGRGLHRTVIIRLFVGRDADEARATS